MQPNATEGALRVPLPGDPRTSRIGPLNRRPQRVGLPSAREQLHRRYQTHVRHNPQCGRQVGRHQRRLLPPLKPRVSAPTNANASKRRYRGDITGEPIDSIRETSGAERVVADVLVSARRLWTRSASAIRFRCVHRRSRSRNARSQDPRQLAARDWIASFAVSPRSRSAAHRQPDGPLRGRRPAGWLMRAATRL